MHDISLREIMVSHVITAHIDDHLSSVEEKMHTHKIRHVPVVDSQNKVIGIITYRDLLGCASLHRTEEGTTLDKDDLDQFILKHVMTKEPQTLKVTDTIAHAVMIMAREKYGCIPVVAADGVLEGIVTQIDILKWLGKNLEKDGFR